MAHHPNVFIPPVTTLGPTFLSASFARAPVAVRHHANVVLPPLGTSTGGGEGPTPPPTVGQIWPRGNLAGVQVS